MRTWLQFWAKSRFDSSWMVPPGWARARVWSSWVCGAENWVRRVCYWQFSFTAPYRFARRTVHTHKPRAVIHTRTTPYTIRTYAAKACKWSCWRIIAQRAHNTPWIKISSGRFVCRRDRRLPSLKCATPKRRRTRSISYLAALDDKFISRGLRRYLMGWSGKLISFGRQMRLMENGAGRKQKFALLSCITAWD
jgi:hypothetical protein